MIKSRLLPMLALGLMTTACQTPSTGPGLRASSEIVDRICSDAWQGVTYDSVRDTPETIASARANNRARTAFCTGNPPNG